LCCKCTTGVALTVPYAVRVVTGIPDHTTILTRRLTLSALTVDDADEMVSVLGDDRLYEFVGGRPATPDELRDRYRHLVAGPKHPGEVWLNWIVRTSHARIHPDHHASAIVARRAGLHPTDEKDEGETVWFGICRLPPTAFTTCPSTSGPKTALWAPTPSR
jgi:hypothetical protein